MNNLTPQELLKKIIDAGFSQNHIAIFSGVSQPVVSRILNGEIPDPKGSIVKKLEHFAMLNAKLVFKLVDDEKTGA